MELSQERVWESGFQPWQNIENHQGNFKTF